MPGNRQQVNTQLVHVDPYLARGGDRVGVAGHAGLPADSGNLGNRLYSPDLVVRKHHRDEGGLRSQCALHPFWVNQAVPVNRHRRHARRTRSAAFQHGAVLNRAADNMFAPVRPRVRRALDCPVVRLAASAGEENLVRTRAEESGDLLPRFGHCLGALPAEAVNV